MLIDNMKDLIKGTFSGVALILIIIAILCVVPAILVFCINSLAASGGSDFHLQHGIWNYFLLTVMVLILGVASG